MMSDNQNQDNDDESVIPPLPSLTPNTVFRGTTSTITNSSSSSQKRNAFQINNTVRADSHSAKKAKVGDKGYVPHPSKIKTFQDLLNQTNLRRIPENRSDEFSKLLRDFLLDKIDRNCFSQKHNKETACTCLSDLLKISDNAIHALSDMVTSFYNNKMDRRDQIICVKLHNLMDHKLEPWDAPIIPANQHQPPKKDPMKLRFTGKCFSVRGRFGDNYDLVSTHNLCIHAYLSLYGIGAYKLKKYKEAYNNTDGKVVHGLALQKSNASIKLEIKQSIRDFMKDLESEGDEYASRQVRTRLGTSYLRDNEIGGIRLPPSYSKRLIYHKWCFKRGWIVGGGGSDSSTGSIKTFKVRPNDEIDWPEGSEPQPIASRTTFMSLWNTEFKHIKIGSAAKDTCTDCWEFKRAAASHDKSRRNGSDDDDDDNNEQVTAISIYDQECPTIGVERSEHDDLEDEFTDPNNSHKSSSNIVTPNPKIVDINALNASDSSYSYSSVYCNFINNPPGNSTIPGSCNGALSSTGVAGNDDDFDEEINVIKWKNHVESFRAQRKYVNELAAEAKSHLEKGVQWPDHKYTFCSDYCQNMDLPHFGSEQPGDTYYYSPLNISCFGSVDFATEKLDAFVYTEATGKKGGNNVSSLLYKKLKDNGIIDLAKTKGPGCQLSLVFDNCAGQNKNRMVLRFAQYLVDTLIFKRVQVVFLVMGHTKNICDRRFKDLKLSFHHKNVYTFSMLIDCLSHNNSDYVNVIPVVPEDFFDWDSFFFTRYKKAIKDTSKYHCFFFDSNYSGQVLKKFVVSDQFEHKEYLPKLKKMQQTRKRMPGFVI